MTKPIKATALALLLAAGPASACGPLWVNIQGGESRLLGSFRPYYPATVSVPCGESAELVIAENTGKFFSRSGSIYAEFDGHNLFLKAGIRPYQIAIPPNGTPTRVLLDDEQLFRGGVVLTAIQDMSR